jgi:hypothetical protein
MGSDAIRPCLVDSGISYDEIEQAFAGDGFVGNCTMSEG